MRVRCIRTFAMVVCVRITFCFNYYFPYKLLLFTWVVNCLASFTFSARISTFFFCGNCLFLLIPKVPRFFRDERKFREWNFLNENEGKKYSKDCKLYSVFCCLHQLFLIDVCPLANENIFYTSYATGFCLTRLFERKNIYRNNLFLIQVPKYLLIPFIAKRFINFQDFYFRNVYSQT